jgi:hypothetical protein
LEEARLPPPAKLANGRPKLTDKAIPDGINVWDDIVFPAVSDQGISAPAAKRLESLPQPLERRHTVACDVISKRENR